MTDEAIEKTYNATKEAYFAVDNIKDNKYDIDIELLKSKKDIAIQDYQDNQMSISTQRSSISGNLNIFIKYLFLIRLHIRCYIVHYSVMQSVSTYTLEMLWKN